MPAGDDVCDGAEEKESEAVRYQERQQTGQTKLHGELHREKKTQAPDPGEGDCVSPEQGIEKTETWCSDGGNRHEANLSVDCGVVQSEWVARVEMLQSGVVKGTLYNFRLS